MTRFLPVIVAGNPHESFSGNSNPLLSALRSVSDARFLEPVVTVHAAFLDDAVAMCAKSASKVTFVAMPDGTPSEAMAAAGVLTAEFIDEQVPVVLIDPRAERAPANTFSRDVAASVRDVKEGAIVAFTDNGRTTGDFAFLASSARAEYEYRLPGVLNYAAAALDAAPSEGNVILADGVPFIGRAADGMADVFLHAADVREVRCVDMARTKMFSPWTEGRGAYEGFYASSFPA